MKRFLLFLFAVLTGLTSFATDYKLVTDVSQLEVGAKYIVVAEYNSTTYAMGAKTGSNNYRDVIKVSAANNGIISISNEAVSPITLENGTGNTNYPYLLKDGELGYLYPNSSSSNNMGLTTESNDYAKTSISINADSYQASITFNRSKSGGDNFQLRYNNNNNKPRFSCYNSTSTTIFDGYLYKEIPDTKVYFNNSKTAWETVYVYAWDSSTDDYKNAEWPGEAATYNASTGLYEYTVNGEFNKVIFNNGDKGGSQTPNLDLVLGNIYNDKLPETMFVIGDIQGITSWDTNSGLALVNKGNNVFEINNVTVNADKGYGYFYFIPELKPSESWNDITVYGSVGANTEVTTGQSADVYLFRQQSWKLANGTYKFILDLNTMKLTVSDPMPEHVYLMGHITVNEKNYWKPEFGLEMTQTSNGIFEIDNVYVGEEAPNAGKGTIGFTTVLDRDWDLVDPARYGSANSDGYRIYAGNEYGVAKNKNSWTIASGQYKFTLNLISNTLKVEAATSPVTYISDLSKVSGTTGAFSVAAPATAVAQQGSNLWIKDNSGWMLVYGDLGNVTYTNGDVIPAGYGGSYKVFNGLPEMENPTGFVASTEKVDAVQPEKITATSLANATLNSYVELTGKVEGSGRNYTLTDDTGTAAIRTSSDNITVTTGEKVVVRGFASIFVKNGTTTYQITPVESFVATPVVYPETMYIFSNVNTNGGFKGGTGIEMTKVGDGIFRIDHVTVDEAGLILFSSDNTDDWENYAYGAINENDKYITTFPATKTLVKQNPLNPNIFSTLMGKYNIEVNLIENTMYIEQMTYPENVYVLGNISRHHWKPDYTGAKMRMENDGKYHIYGVKFETQGGNEVAYFTLSTMPSTEWKEVNANQYGAVAVNTAIENEVETQVMKGINNWTAAPGTYDITFDFENLKLTVKANSETNTIYYKPAEGETRVYMFAYKTSTPYTRAATGPVNALWPGEPISVEESIDNTGYIRCEVSNTFDKIEFNDGTSRGVAIDNVPNRNYSRTVYLIGDATGTGWTPDACIEMKEEKGFLSSPVYVIDKLTIEAKADGKKNYFHLTATQGETAKDWDNVNAGAFGAPEADTQAVVDGTTENRVLIGSNHGWIIPAGEFEVKFKPAENVLILKDLDPAGINNVDAEAENAEFYNIQGIRMNKSQKGLNIIRRNGKTYKTAVR